MSPHRVVGVLALLPASWAAVIFVMLVAEWYNGNPEGERIVDSLIQSERGMVQESFHQWLRRVGVGN